eukprot:scaffold44739_cov15-Tisochrysis_lutea.AAC.2
MHPQRRPRAHFCQSAGDMLFYSPLHICNMVKLQEEVKLLERARNDMQVEESFVHDKYKQIKAENERLQAEINKYRSRLGNATEDYVSFPSAWGACVPSHKLAKLLAEQTKLVDSVREVLFFHYCVA